jgi:hypothetical protein
VPFRETITIRGNWPVRPGGLARRTSALKTGVAARPSRLAALDGESGLGDLENGSAGFGTFKNA